MKHIMKIQLKDNTTFKTFAGTLAVFVLFFVFGTSVLAQVDYDYGGGDYGYNYTTYNDYEPVDYTYGGGDYGYNYTTYNDYEPVVLDDYDTYTPDYNTYSYNDYPAYNDYGYTPDSYNYTSYSNPSYPNSYSNYSYSNNSYTYSPPQHNNDTNPRCDSLTASDTRVNDGDYITLTWRTTDANRVSINQGIGNVSNDGNKRVRITGDTTFTLTARDKNDSDTCTVTIRVDEEEEEEEDDKEVPRCRLYISDTKITAGQAVELRWNNERTDRAVLKDSHGKEIFDTKDDRKFDEDADKITLHPTRATDYTLTVYNKNVTRTCTVGVDMEKVSVTGVRYQGINLGQVPYTGFEAGPVLTFAFYGVVALWGLIMGYVLVFKKTALATVATATVASHALPALTSVASSVTSVPSAESVLPNNLPVEETMEVIPNVSPDALHALEAFAHEQYILLSSDVLNHVYALETDDETRLSRLASIIEVAKAKFPKEGDWTIINKERLMEVLG